MVAGYTDYLSDLQIMQQELKPAGINLVIDQEAYTAFISDQDNGNFQLLMDSLGYTPDPWSYYYTVLDSSIAGRRSARPTRSATSGATGIRRWTRRSATIAWTTSTAAQQPAFDKIETIFQQDMPLIPLWESQDEIEFNGNFVGNIPDRVEPVRRRQLSTSNRISAGSPHGSPRRASDHDGPG